MGLVVSTDGIKPDPKKVEAISNWKAPQGIGDIRSLVGFANFYRRFVPAFSRLVSPMVKQLSKGQIFNWSRECQDSFDKLKTALVTAPVMHHFDRAKKCFVETDASDFVVAGVLSQMGEGGLLHPVAYYSQKMAPAECNYEIFDKELLAIIRCFEAWRPELQGTQEPVDVQTDHKALQWWSEQRVLSRRQCRWMEFMQDFNFKITYRPGKDNGKADALTRRTGDFPTDSTDERITQ